MNARLGSSFSGNIEVGTRLSGDAVTSVGLQRTLRTDLPEFFWSIETVDARGILTLTCGARGSAKGRMLSGHEPSRDPKEQLLVGVSATEQETNAPGVA